MLGDTLRAGCLLLALAQCAFAARGPTPADVHFSRIPSKAVKFDAKWWALRDGALESTSVHGGYKFIEIGPSDGKIGEVSFKVKLLERLPDKDAFAVFRARGVSVRLRGWGADQLLYWAGAITRRNYPKPINVTIPSDVWLDARLVITGDLATFYLNGRKVFDLPNPPPEKLQGPLILGRWRARVAYKDVKVTHLADGKLARHNYAVNGSFEHATNRGIPDYWTDNPALTGINDVRWLSKDGWRLWHESWHQDETNPFHGRYCMRIKHPLVLVSRAFSVRGGRDYVVSAYMRADRPGLQAELTAYRAGQRKPAASAKFAVGLQWQRFHVSISRLDSLNLSVSFKPLESGALWVDAVAIEEGAEPGPYRPSSWDKGFELIGKPVEQPPPPPPGRATPPPGANAVAIADGTVRLDGKLDEAAWARARWYRLCETTGAPAKLETRFAAMFDKSNLYLGVRCAEPEPDRMATKAVAHDFPVWSHDSLEIFISSAPDGGRYFQLALNASGSRADMRRAEKGADWKWDGPWNAKCTTSRDSWAAEIVIALKMFPEGARVGPGTVWRLNVCRNRPSHGQLFNWSPTSGSFHRPERFGYLRFGEGPLPHLLAGFKDVRLLRKRDGAMELAGILVNRTAKPLKAVVSAKLDSHTSTPLTVSVPAGGTSGFALPVPSSTNKATATLVADFGPERGKLFWSGTVERASALEAFTERDYYTGEERARLVLENRLPRAIEARIRLEDAELKFDRPTTVPAAGRTIVAIPIKDLKPGRYRIGCSSPAGNARAALRKLPPARTEVKVDRLRRIILVDGEPYFPYGVFYLTALDKPALERYRDEGFDFLAQGAPYWLDQRKCVEGIRAADELGIRSIIFCNVHPTRPKDMKLRGAHHARYLADTWSAARSVIGYIPADEVDKNLDPVYRWVKELKALDPYRLVFPNHNLSGLKTFRNAGELPGDVLSMDRYPIWPKPGDPRATDEIYTLELAAVETERDGRRLRKPIFHFLQNYGSAREPTPREQEWMNYITVIHGCRGIYYYFNQPRSVDHWNRIKQLREEMKALLPVLAEPDDVKTVRAEPANFVAFLAKRHDGALYLISVNRARRPVEVAFDLSAAAPGAKGAKVMFEHRSVRLAAGGILNDRFESLQRHVYRVR